MAGLPQELLRIGVMNAPTRNDITPITLQIMLELALVLSAAKLI